MPWTAKDVDRFKKGLSAKSKSKWVAIANSVLSDCMKKGGTDATCAPQAIRIANSQVESTGDLEQMEDFDIINELIEEYAKELEGEDELLAQVGSKKNQGKPGGSSAGTYKKNEGPFCGPSGGAPAGTFPVGTRKRAQAALAYARNAPNPDGVKACVYRHWPDFPGAKKTTKKQSEPTVEVPDEPIVII